MTNNETTEQQQRIDAYDRQRAAEKAHAAARAAAFRVTAAAVARALGDGWTLAPVQVHDMGGELSPVLQRGDDERITLSNGGYQMHGRIGVSVSYPTMPNGSQWYRRDESNVSITVSADKLPTTIARDITRRVLPAYRAQLVKAHEAIAAERARIAGCASLFDQVIAAGAGHFRAHGRNSDTKAATEKGATLYQCGGVSYCDLRVSSDSVTFERLSASGPAALAIIAAIAAQCGEKGGE